jgi:hypothetical protein
MLDVINFSSEDTARLLHLTIEHLRDEARVVTDSIDESRRLSIEESVNEGEVGRQSVGMVRRRPPTDLEMLRIVFERLHQRLIVLPAIALALQEFLGVPDIVWRADQEFVPGNRLPLLEASIDDLLPQWWLQAAYATPVPALSFQE